MNYGRHLLIEADGELIQAITRGRKLKPVCGDLVYWQFEEKHKAVISDYQERRSILKRHDDRDGSRILAANVDVLLVVMAAEPTPDIALIDRYLVAGEALNLDINLVFNKMDLLSPARERHWQQQLQPYLDLGYPLHWTNAKDAGSLSNLLATLKDRCGMLVGPSGAGKSSLIKSLVPDHAPRTQALSTASGQGQHTTTATRLYRLPAENGGMIIDSPGVRDFRLWDMPLTELANCYREFRPLIEQCRFSNCRHLKEPNCAIKQAIENNKIMKSRYKSYALLAELIES